MKKTKRSPRRKTSKKTSPKKELRYFMFYDQNGDEVFCKDTSAPKRKHVREISKAQYLNLSNP